MLERARAAALGVLAVALAVSASVAGVQSWRLHTLQRDQALTVAKAAEQAVIDEREARAEEKRLKAKVQEPATRDRTIDAPARAAAAERLHAAAASLLSVTGTAGDTATGDPADPGGSAPAAGTGLVPAHLLGRCGQRFAELAEYATAAAAAGRVCERGWDAMTAGQPTP